MSRVTEVSNVTIRKEPVSPIITIIWDPLDDTGKVEFETKVYNYSDDELLSISPGPVLAYSLEDILSRSVSIPLPDGSTFEFPPQLIGAYIKKIFDDLYVEYINSNTEEPETPA